MNFGLEDKKIFTRSYSKRTNRMLSKIFLISIIISLISFESVKSAKILAVFPSINKSNFIFSSILLKELAARGHELTIISTFNPRQYDGNVTQIQIKGTAKHMEEFGITSDFFKIAEWSSNEQLTSLIYGNAAMTDYTLSYPEVQDLLKSDAEFDLLMSDILFSDALLGIAHYYKIPSISLASMGMNRYVDESVGNPSNPSFNPCLLLGYSNQMDFMQRITNTIFSVLDRLSYRFLYLPTQEAIYRRHFTELLSSKNEELPPLIDLIHNVSMVLVNSHSAVGYTKPYVPSVVEVGGIHIKNPVQLPPDVSKFIEEAKDGVIYFSLGSNIKTSELPKEKLEAFVKVFTSLKTIRVIMKWEEPMLPDQPLNVVVGPWLPQQDILAHPHVRLFITHGGILSTMEAVHSSTPIIGLPIYGDQINNVHMAEQYGYARKLDYNNITEESLQEVIQDVFYNPKYRKNVMKLSKLFKDNQVNPLEKAVYSVEYVLRTNGAHHLRSATVNLPLWKFLLLDVSFVILVGILVIILVPFLIIGFILRKNYNSATAARTALNKKAVNKIKKKD